MKRTRPTAAITAEAVKFLKAGVALEVVARLILGSKHDSMYRWLVVGAGQDPKMIRIPKPYRLFHDSIVKAQAEAEARNTLALQRGGNPKWALEWLRRRAPERWSATEATAVLVPFAGRDGQTHLLPAGMADQIRAMKSEPYTDPRMLEGDPEPEPKEPAVVVEDIIEVRPGCDRPHKDDPEDVEGRSPAAIPEVTKRPVID